MCRLRQSVSGQEAVLDSCDHDSEISGFMTREKILDFLKELLQM
jgi:hypothetical protein